MNHPLAVFTPTIGVRSETFIRRHMEDLLPGRCAAITGRILAAEQGGSWSVDAPVFTLRGATRRVLRRLQLPVKAFSSAALERFLKKHDVRVIMGEYLDESLQLLSIAQDLGIRFFAHAHGYDVSLSLKDSKWVSAYQRFNDSDGIIAMSGASRARLIDLGIRPAKVHAIPYGVDVPETPVRRPDNKIIRCLAVGRMVSKKAPLITLDAFRRAKASCPELRLEVIGTGELLASAQQFVRESNLESSVTFHGGQPSDFVQNLLANVDIFLQHSVIDPVTGDEEGLPVAILEAMARSLPVVSTRHAGIPEAVVSGTTGYLSAEGDVTAMAEHTLMLARNHELRTQMGIAGWQRARELFSWERERAQLLQVLGLKGERHAS